MEQALLLTGIVFAILALIEMAVPARAAMRGRWPVNIGLGMVNLALVRLAAAAGPFALATLAAREDFGLFNNFALPEPWVWIATIVLMDLAIYWQHRASHGIGWFWALHKLHHADTDFDVTTGLRFHPGEALVSMLYKGGMGALLGAPPAAMLAFEAYLAIGSLTEHANIRLPGRLDRFVSRIWVTPSLHRVHHSATGDDHNHNFGFAIAIWDRLFETWQAPDPVARIGLPVR